jgi:predicted branched-subunit amino acid permease
MSKAISLNLNPDDKTLRQFGYIALVGFGLLAFLAWVERAIFAFGLGNAREPLAYAFLGLAALSLFFALVYPRGNRLVYVGLSVLTYPIGFVLSYVIMGSLFFFVFGLPAILIRAVGRDVMHRSYDPKAPSYWTERKGRRPSSSYFRQF